MYILFLEQIKNLYHKTPFQVIAQHQLLDNLYRRLSETMYARSEAYVETGGRNCVTLYPAFEISVKTFQHMCNMTLQLHIFEVAIPYR